MKHLPLMAICRRKAIFHKFRDAVQVIVINKLIIIIYRRILKARI